MKYAIMEYTPKGVRNVGDGMQLFAIKNLYHIMGISDDDLIRINYYDLSSYNGEKVILPICFPLFGYRENQTITCFSPKIYPLFLAVSILTSELSSKDVAYFKQFEPIGCRDEYTKNIMRKYGIKAYLNGCLTLTLPQRPTFGTRNKIFCVDISKELQSRIPAELQKKCNFFSHIVDNSITDIEKCAHDLYNCYSDEAKLVITARLHCAMPCIAAGIPVIFVHDTYSQRFTWIESITNIYTPDMYNDIVWNPAPINCDVIKQSMIDHAIYRLQNLSCDVEMMHKIESIYAKRLKREYILDAIHVPIQYINKHWQKGQQIKYAIWGIDQSSPMLYQYIRKHYPNATLVEAIDSFKQFEFYGLQTRRVQNISDISNIFVFVCACSAIPYAKKYFESISKTPDSYLMCWTEEGINVYIVVLKNTIKKAPSKGADAKKYERAIIYTPSFRARLWSIIYFSCKRMELKLALYATDNIITNFRFIKIDHEPSSYQNVA